MGRSRLSWLYETRKRAYPVGALFFWIRFDLGQAVRRIRSMVLIIIYISIISFIALVAALPSHGDLKIDFFLVIWIILFSPTVLLIYRFSRKKKYCRNFDTS
jgi:hypothetical protein